MSDNPTISLVTGQKERFGPEFEKLGNSMQPETFMLFQIVHALVRNADTEQQKNVKETIEKTITEICASDKKLTTKDHMRALDIGHFFINTIPTD